MPAPTDPMKIVSASTKLGLAGEYAYKAAAYALSAFHNPSRYYEEVALNAIAEARAHLNAAEALLTPATVPEGEIVAEGV